MHSTIFGMNIFSSYSLIGDCFIFSLSQIVFLTSFVFIYIYDKGWCRQDRGIVVEVKRGVESWGYFYAMYGFLSVIFLEVINTTEAYKGYKTFITIIDLSVLLYLCFFSGWFRNKIVGIFSKSKDMTEK